MIPYVFICLLNIYITSALIQQTVNLKENNTKKCLRVFSAFPPIWTTSYIERIGLQDRLLVNDPRQFLHNEATYAKVFCVTTESPWTISEKSIYITLNGHNNYQNETVKTQIQDGILRNYTFLIEIAIHYFELDYVSQIMLKDMQRIAAVLLKNNGIKYIESNAFSTLTNLLWLRIDDNKLKTINADYFCQNTRLTFIQLRRNEIYEISTNLNVSINESCTNTIFNLFSVEGNNIQVLDVPIFQRYKLNGRVSLSNCNISRISAAGFDGLQDVLDLDLSLNNIESFDDFTFEALKTSLQRIRLNGNKIQKLQLNIGHGIGLLMNLLSLRIANNEIYTINGTFEHLNGIVEIDISNNFLEYLDNRLFHNLIHLQMLNLSWNSLEVLHSDALKVSINLAFLDISHNKIRTVDFKSFNTLSTLLLVNISFNELTNIDESIFVNCSRLQNIGLSYNKLQSLGRLFLTTHTLQHLDISENYLTSTPSVILPDLNIAWSFNMSHNNIEKIGLENLNNTTILDLSHNKITYLRLFSRWKYLKEPHLDGLSTQQVVSQTSEVPNCYIKVLDLSFNLIKDIAIDAFKPCLELNVLYMAHNNLKTIDVHVLPLNSLSNFTLSNNPLICDCNILPLQNWLKTLVRADNITCSNGTRVIDVNLSNCSSKEKKKESIRIFAIIFVSLLVVFCVIFGFVFWYRYEIQVIAFYKWNIRFTCCNGTRKKDTEIKYDAFICFAEEDIRFVRTELIPLLEPKYKVCIYYRDFIVGDEIAEAIIEVIEQSSVTIILLSEAFVKSRWGRFEFKHAHFNAMQKGDMRLLVVVMKESVLNMNLDLTLRSILYSKNYLRKEDTLFKEKMIYALPQQPFSTNTLPQEQQPLLTGTRP